MSALAKETERSLLKCKISVNVYTRVTFYSDSSIFIKQKRNSCKMYEIH